MEQSLKVHLKHPQLYPAFAPATALSAGFDLRWPEREITLLPNERTAPTDLGVSLDLRDLPPCMALIAPRSGLGSRGLNLANTLGVIDQDYTDPLIATLVNTGRREIVIRTGDRILQLLLVPILRPTVTLTSAINGSGRGMTQAAPAAPGITVVNTIDPEQVVAAGLSDRAFVNYIAANKSQVRKALGM